MGEEYEQKVRGSSSAWLGTGGGGVSGAWNRGRVFDGETSRGGGGGGGEGGGGNSDGTSRQHYPGAFSKGGGTVEGRAGDPIGQVADSAGGGGGGRAGSGPDRRRSVPGSDMLPKEIYQKLSEHVIGQVRNLGRLCFACFL